MDTIITFTSMSFRAYPKVVFKSKTRKVSLHYLECMIGGPLLDQGIDIYIIPIFWIESCQSQREEIDRH